MVGTTRLQLGDEKSQWFAAENTHASAFCTFSFAYDSRFGSEQRNMNADSRATRWLRFNKKLSLNQAQPLAHAD